MLTHSDAPLEWDNSGKLSGDAAGGGCEAQADRGPRPADPGQQHALRAIARRRADRPAGADDFPALLGEGKRIFDGSREAGALKLVDHFVASTGATTTIYEPAGEVPTGTFETKPPSEAELKRRQQWAREDA